MNLNMTFKHMDATDAIKSITREKTEKLKSYFDGHVSVSWNFTVEKLAHVAHCHLVGNHMDFFGEASSEDLYKSIDLALDKVERQIRRHKEIVTDHVHRAARAAKA